MHQDNHHLLSTMRMALWSIVILLAVMGLLIMLLFVPPAELEKLSERVLSGNGSWRAPDSTQIPGTPEGDLIRYGRELVAHTSVYLGPKGSVSKVSNGMNCQNCHLKAGKKMWANNYSAVASTYPKYRPRSGQVESVEKRINDCFQRSLNGQALAEDSREMKALVSYIQWVGSEVEKGEVPEGVAVAALPVLERPANPSLGMNVYVTHCARCHGDGGKGKLNHEETEWHYPPLWGEQSFNTGAGLLRLSRMAGFVQKNMPNDIGHVKGLTEEEAWDVAAFICSQPRPVMDISRDWPDLSQKPFDHPFGPYSDAYPESQHRLGPFGPIVAAQKK